MRKIGSVALADILANGVAILLILIVLSLSIRQQDLEQELEQIKQIGSVMSRTIASSLITNSLPSSTPAILHNYNHPRQKNTVRIVLYKNYLLIDGNGIYKNLKISTAELLRKNNRFDQFLTSKNLQKTTIIRADIIHIKNYYLMMSILKEHKKSISHWHFLGIPDNKPISYFANNTQDNQNAMQMSDEKLLPTDDMLEADINFLTKNVDFFSGKNNGKNQQNSNALNIDNNGSEIFLGSSSINSLELARKAAKISGLENQNFAKSLKIGFADGDLSITDLKSNDNNTKQLAKQILALIFAYLTDRQDAYKNSELVEITSTDFKNRLSKKVDNIYQTKIKQIYNNISAINKQQIKINFDNSNTYELGVLINKNLSVLNLSIPPLKEVNLKNIITLNLYPKPTIDKAIKVSINDNSILLFANNNIQNNLLDWQLVAVLNAGLNEIKIGFIYGKLVDELLKIKVLENDIRINNIIINNIYQQNSNWKYWQWIGLILIFLMFIKLLYRRSNV